MVLSWACPHPASHGKNSSSFKSVVKWPFKKLSFELYNSFLGQLAQNLRAIKVWSVQKRCILLNKLQSFWTLKFLKVHDFCASWPRVYKRKLFYCSIESRFVSGRIFSMGCSTQYLIQVMIFQLLGVATLRMVPCPNFNLILKDFHQGF